MYEHNKYIYFLLSHNNLDPTFARFFEQCSYILTIITRTNAKLR